MIKEILLSIPPKDIQSPKAIIRHIQTFLSLKKTQHLNYEILKRSVDARSRQVFYQLKLRVYIDEQNIPKIQSDYQARDVSNSPEVVIIGAGPAGLFCALQCIVVGLKPVIIERGKNVRDRRRDLAILNREGVLNEESNYCFGEGGAGTYSDGKLYTRSNKRGNIQQVLEWFHYFGADVSIRYDAHPHIGTNKLPQIIEAIREQIIACGGDIQFNTKMTDLKLNGDRVEAVQLNHKEYYPVKHLVLATGHSASDVYELLHQKNILMEAKPFALGVRIEHPQEIIDSIQYHCDVRDKDLPPASYSLVDQVGERGVFSFCMCPGGIIAPASTQQNALVVNGWSPSKRNNPYANSGMVVSVDQRDFGDKDVLAGLHFQQAIEQKAFKAGGGLFQAPAQRMTDFVERRWSSSLPACSYLPGVNSVLLQEVLPTEIYDALAKAFVSFGKKMMPRHRKEGYYTSEAIVVATESRTSSPVRIPRDKESLQHLQITNLYPCAEGAGYAGGIVSAAMDGMRIALKLKELMNP